MCNQIYYNPKAMTLQISNRYPAKTSGLHEVRFLVSLATTRYLLSFQLESIIFRRTASDLSPTFRQNRGLSPATVVCEKI